MKEWTENGNEHEEEGDDTEKEKLLNKRKGQRQRDHKKETNN